ncbi:kinase-like domain-containing protein [Gorgonomyces haynaldii]|nr:kinase-like domain-containing protein [Gorgonomyces haynaldii]
MFWSTESLHKRETLRTRIHDRFANQSVAVTSSASGKRLLKRSLSADFDERKFVVETSIIYTKTDKICVVDQNGKQERVQGKINQYHIVRQIGAGSFGRVMLTRDEKTLRYYALKMLSKKRIKKQLHRYPLGRATDAEVIEHVKREVNVLKQLQHPNIVQLVEVLDDASEDELYMFFELCEYGPVMNPQPGEQVRPFSEPLARQYFRDTVLGLEYIHHRKIVHRDIKPENLLLNAEHRVLISDFGIAHSIEEDKQVPFRNATPMFLAPEGFMGTDPKMDCKALDVWALGVTLYCFVHGFLPFEDEDHLELARKVCYDEPSFADTLSPGLRDLLQKMLIKEPHMRILISQIKSHPWVTDSGKSPMPSTNQNCQTKSTPKTNYFNKAL